MPPRGVVPALGAEPEELRSCMFCGASLADRGPAFIDHIEQSPDCRATYEAWLERLDQDRPGG